jgi:hypothetical protein
MKIAVQIICYASLICTASLWAGEAAPSEQESLAIYNKAQAAQTAGDHRAALKGFLAVKKQVPDDWRTRAKIVQEYSALGMKKERDKEIGELYAWRNAQSKEAQADLPYFVREQFSVAQRKLMVVEHFTMQGERPVKYAFIVLDNTGKKREFTISLGSYNTTTEAARALGTIGADERLYHLDGYFEGGVHQTYSFFKGEPKYDEVRQMVVQILGGKLQAVSGMKPAGAGGGEKKK